MTRSATTTGLIGAAAVAAVVARFLIDRPLTGGIAFSWPGDLVVSFRVTAIVAGAIIGVALATSGVLLQSLLRNPLASPFVLGLSSGAGLGVMVAMYVAYVTGGAVVSIGAQLFPALLGAVATLGIVWAISQRRGWLDPLTLILSGVIISTIAGAAMVILQHLVPLGLRGQFLGWMMGTIPEVVPMGTLVTLGAVTLGCVVAVMPMAPAMDVMALPDEEAIASGVHLGRMRWIQFVISGLLAAIAVSLAGPVAFVGLVAPHVARMLVGPHHRMLLPASALCGIALVVGADTLRQSIDLGAGRLPLGALVTLIGGPFFLWLILRGRLNW
jgi:iron complex transport system permease protein